MNRGIKSAYHKEHKESHVKAFKKAIESTFSNANHLLILISNKNIYLAAIS